MPRAGQDEGQRIIRRHLRRRQQFRRTGWCDHFVTFGKREIRAFFANQLAQAWGAFLQINGVLPSPAELSALGIKKDGDWWLTDANFARYCDGATQISPNQNAMIREQLKFSVNRQMRADGLQDPWARPGKPPRYYRFSFDAIHAGGGITGFVAHPDPAYKSSIPNTPTGKARGAIAVWSFGKDGAPGRDGEWPDLEGGEKPADDIITIL